MSELEDVVKYFANQVKRQVYLTESILELAGHRFWEEECDKPRNKEPKRLLRHGYKIYSQYDEDGQIDEIFKRIGIESSTFIEIGVEANESNTAKLLAEGWSGIWIEANEKSVEYIRNVLFDYRGLSVIKEMVTISNANELVGQRNSLDLLSIDIDYNDYWVWEAIEAKPRVVVIEYNSTWRPPISVVVPYDERGWDGSNYYGASLEALVKLGNIKGYKLVGCSYSGSNAFFVRDDLVGDKFHKPFTAEEHYEPPRYCFPLLSGHAPCFGPLIRV